MCVYVHCVWPMCSWVSFKKLLCLNPALMKQRQVDLCEFETSLVSISFVLGTWYLGMFWADSEGLISLTNSTTTTNKNVYRCFACMYVCAPCTFLMPLEMGRNRTGAVDARKWSWVFSKSNQCSSLRHHFSRCALAALAEDLGSIPSTHISPYNHPWLLIDSSWMASSDFCGHQACKRYT